MDKNSKKKKPRCYYMIALSGYIVYNVTTYLQ